MILEQAEIVVVGSGPGGAAVARRLARAGRRVLILERGSDWRENPLYGTYPGALMYADRGALLFSREGMNIVRPLMLGGATSMYCGCSAPPAAWWAERYGIDLSQRAARIAEELRVAPLTPELRGIGSTRIAEAGLALGMPWHAQDKFMQPARARPFDCGAKCMLGCRCGAKWNAAEWIDDAVEAGAELLTRARVTRILTEGAAAVGVAGRLGRRSFRVEADHVVIAAGGLGTPPLLRSAGIRDAGRGMAMDTTTIVYGVSPDVGMGGDPPMTWSCPDDELGVLYSTLVDPWLMYPIIMTRKGLAHPLTWRRWRRLLGVMIKLKDEVSGGIGAGGIRKGLTARDERRLGAAESAARRILREAGCSPETMLTTPLRGTHPSATARIGDVVSATLETGLDRLYVCDASVFPEALGRPTVLTILALGDRLADHLLVKIGAHATDTAAAG